MIPLKDDNPSRTFPAVTVGIIATAVAVYFYQLSLGEYEWELFNRRLGAVPYKFTHFQDIEPTALIPYPLTIFSSMFMHEGFFHIFFNMLFLWVFGNNVEDTFGHFRFLLFYLTAGAAAAATQIITDVNSPVPMIGASGAIAGVLGAYALLFPRAKVSTLFIFYIPMVIKMPAILFLGIWFLLQILLSSVGGSVAWYAHIGGFIVGIILVPFFEKRPKEVLRIVH